MMPAAVIDPDWWVTASWRGEPLADCLVRRDASAIFGAVHSRGLSYTAIANLVGLSPTRVAEIAKGARQVSAYEVLDRIAEGLSIPRHLLGLGTTAPPSSVTSETVGGGGLSMAALAAVRKQMDGSLSASSVGETQMGFLEDAVADHLVAYPLSPPVVSLGRLATDCAEVARLSEVRQPAAMQARLSAAGALLATMCADALMRLGELEQARLWYRTAGVAASDSGQPRLEVLVAAQAAMLPYYYGDVARTVRLTERALAVPAPPSGSTVLAWAARARALARLGAESSALEAIGQAQRLFEQVADPDCDDAFRFPAKRLLFYLSGAYTWLGDRAAAFRVQEEALELYKSSPASVIDPTLIALDQAMCLAADRRADEAAHVAVQALARTDLDHRAAVMVARARDVLSAASNVGTTASAVRELADFIGEPPVGRPSIR